MISSAYSYYLSNYAGRQTGRTNNASQRKPDEVRRAYNRLLKINRNSPAYKTDISTEAQKYAIDLKESARELDSIAESLSGEDDTSLVVRQSAVSDNPDAVSVRYTGGQETSDLSFEVNVSQLATPQINTGNYLPQSSKLLTPGDYSFELNISDITYEFEFGVGADNTSKDVQDKIARLVNRSNIGLDASVVTDDINNTALRIESHNTGVSGITPVIFEFEDNPEDAARDLSVVNTLGLDRVSQHPSNAVYSIDGNERTSASNTVTVGNAYELTFRSVSEEPVTISLKADSEAIADSIDELVSGYNKLISTATDSSRDGFDGSTRLKRQFAHLSRTYSDVLQQSGLDISDNGSITINRNTVMSLADNGDLSKVYDGLGKFKDALQDTAEQIAMNPMDYVNNKMIAYKNPHRITTDPYNLSAYTGMMFNGYI